MTPDELRLLTDPAARNDPSFVRRVQSGKRRDMRSRALGMLRVTSIALGFVGLLLLGLSALLSIRAVVSRPVASVGAPMGALEPAFFLAPFGVVLVGLAFWLWVPSRGVLTRGVPAQASVLQVLGLSGSLRVKGPNVYARLSKATVRLRVMPSNGAPYDVTHRERILDSDVTALQVGATLPVRVSPSRPTKLLIDWDALR